MLLVLAGLLTSDGVSNPFWVPCLLLGSVIQAVNIQYERKLAFIDGRHQFLKDIAASMNAKRGLDG